MKAWKWIAVAVIGCAALIAVSYNGFISNQQSVKNQFAQLETQFQRRFDLIPNLVNTAKGYMAYEKNLFEEIARARQSYLGATSRTEKVEAIREFEAGLTRFFALAENYPHLKASEPIQKLMDELAGTENRVSVERMRYNEAVKAYNMRVQSFPSNITAKVFGFSEEPYIKSVEAAHAPIQVSFE